jgi:hypothetical protein
MTIYFYKVDAPYGCFSNFSPHPINCLGWDWFTVEHYYQAQKFIGTKDESIIKIIRQAKTPEEAAALGRNPKYQVRCDWDEVKIQVMWEGVLTKFLTHIDIQTILLATEDELIVEDSPRDYFWGCGKDGTGRNELGKTLMAIRQKLRQISKK